MVYMRLLCQPILWVHALGFTGRALSHHGQTGWTLSPSANMWAVGADETETKLIIKRGLEGGRYKGRLLDIPLDNVAEKKMRTAIPRSEQ